MLQVDLTRDLRPWRAGDSPVLQDDVARKLVETGEATNPRPWPPGAVEAAQAAEKPHGRYFTRGKRR